MSKYEPLWKYLKENNKENYKLYKGDSFICYLPLICKNH